MYKPLLVNVSVSPNSQWGVTAHDTVILTKIDGISTVE